MPTEDELVQALDLVSQPPGAPALQSLSRSELLELRAIRRWTKARGIVGYGLAERVTMGQSVDGDLTLKVYVSKKKTKRQLPVRERVPRFASLPGLQTEIPLDVEEIGDQRLQNNYRIRPLRPGSSIGVVGGETGTLGCLVRLLNPSNTLMLLSNNHVLAGSGRLSKGAVIVQPGPDDGGTVTGDSVGSLFETVAFNFDLGFNNLCDAAVCMVSNATETNPAMPNIALRSTAEKVTRGQQIQKHGRTTGHTTGSVKDVNYRTFMNFPKPNGSSGKAGFLDQVLCSRYSKPGDSGALICDMNGSPVGLHWCGSNIVSVFSPISFVLDALKIEEIITET
ncbi:hypothetical protein ACFVYC_13590 [Pseudarthrobacter sp. NPDC058329]|uniref:hypothetical protein n=1 Tax=Pseudarthrobacter sp. NPDC058329 TaxID=3346448 RepID=UPI0036DE720D